MQAELLRRAPASVRELVGVNRSTWARWLARGSRVPRAVLVLLQILVTGELPQGGREWAGWRFHDGRLYDPSGQWHTPRTIEAWHWLRQELQSLRAKENRQSLEALPANVVRFPSEQPGHTLTHELYQRLGD